MAERIVGRMRTPDGLWTVEVVHNYRADWYRLIHGERVMEDRLVIGSLQHFMEQYGIDAAALIED
jgi:hypothetical protein